jgi:glycosyltransferase involved in cell wall biosynthesis
MEIANRLRGEITGHGLFNGAWYSMVLNLEKLLKLDLVESLHSSRQFSHHNLILSTSERSAIPLAMLLLLARNKKPHFLISHHISSPRKTLLFRVWPLHRTFSHLIFVSRAQADFAVRRMGIPSDRVDFVYDNVDQNFFRPERLEGGDYVLAVGQEQRDYQSLTKALVGTGIKLVIVASSPWSLYPVKIGKISEDNVQVVRNLTFRELRSLYAQARIVVIPLHPNNYAAGVNALLEGMSMGRPVVTSFTAGTRDYVSNGETGRFCPPHDPEALKERILSLWDDVKARRRLGENGRRAVEERMNLDLYVDRVVDIIREKISLSD